MTIWVLALVLLASMAGLGYRQGAIRMAFSFVGIVFGAVLAAPLGRLLARVLVPLGVRDPVTSWALGPLIVFVVISILFMVTAAAVHHKADLYYKYNAGDLRLALWERLSRRLGLCLGVLNGALYLILIAFVIYVPSYLTVQVASTDSDPKWVRLVNTLGRDLHSSGLDKAARAIDSIPQVDYDMADFVALLYRNPSLEARLGSYPPFYTLADLPEIRGLAELREMWQRSEPVWALLQHPKVLAIRNDPAVLKQIWGTVETNLADVRTYLLTGRSPRCDLTPILGRWDFDVHEVFLGIRRAKPNLTASELARQRASLLGNYSKTRFVVRPDGQITLESVPGLEALPPSPMGLRTIQGHWKGEGPYELSFPGRTLPAVVEGDRLTIKNEGLLDLVFYRED
jgi:uncharacterized membrane protein required for colicin V production